MVSLNRIGRTAALMLVASGSIGCSEGIPDTSADTDGTATAQETSDTGPSSGGTTGLTTTPGSTSPTWPGDGSGESTGTDADGAAPTSCENVACGSGGFCEEGEDGPFCRCDDGYVANGLDCLPCDPIGSGALPAEVPTARATFGFTLDGEPSPASGLEFARITLRNRTSGDIVRVGTTNESSTVLMVPGAYEVQYEFREGSRFPKNSASIIQHVEVPAGETRLQINVETATVRGALSLAGGQADTPGLNFGRLWLVDPRTDDRIPLGTTQDDVYETRVTPGRYEVRYEFRESQGEAPINSDAVITTVELTAGTNEVDIDVPVVSASGRVLVDGVPNPSGLDNGNLELRDPKTGDRFPLGETQDRAYQATLLPGSYEIIYTAREFGPLNPVNQGTVAGTLDLQPGRVRQDIDLQTAVISGQFTVDDAPPPTDDFDDGVIVLRDAEGGTVVLGNTQNGSYSRRVLLGDYDLVYAQDTASLTMPVNTQARVRSITVTADETLNIDIPVGEVVGTMTIGGVPAPDSPYDDGRLFLRNPETGDSVLLGNTREGTYAARVIPGTYNVVYSNEFSDTLLPLNQGAILLEDVVVEDGATLDIDVSVAILAGSVGIFGSEPSPNEGVGQLFLRDVATNDTVFLGDTNASDFTKPLTTGRYIMEYRGIPAEGGSLGTSLPANENAAFACFEIVSD